MVKEKTRKIKVPNILAEWATKPLALIMKEIIRRSRRMRTLLLRKNAKILFIIEVDGVTTTIGPYDSWKTGWLTVNHFHQHLKTLGYRNIKVEAITVLPLSSWMIPLIPSGKIIKVRRE